MANGWHRKVDNAATRQRVQDYRSPRHKAARQAGQRLVDSGRAYCWRCGRHLPPGIAWHVGHDDDDRSVIRGTECVRCNLTAAARKGAQIANARRKWARPATGQRSMRRSESW